MSRSSVAAVVADGVARAGVPRVFASPGALVAIGDAAIARGLAVVQTAGATAAGVMAAITAELVDAPGVALVSFAGGLAPVLDGAAHATRDRAAVIVISGGAADSRLLEPVVKATVVADPASAGHSVAHAAQLCMADPRGAVHLVVPAGVAEAPALPVVTACRRAPVPAPAADALDALADSIARAARPVLVAGLETGPDDAKWLRALAESVPAPVLTTPKGKGALPDPHPLVLGLLAAEHPLLAQSDLLIVVGVDPVEVSPGVWPAGVPLARVGRAPGNGVVGEIALVIEELAPRLRGRAPLRTAHEPHDGFERQLHFETGGAGLFAARFDLRILGDCGGNRVGQLSCEPVDDVVHPYVLLRPPAALAAAMAQDDARVVAIGAAAGFAAMAGEWPTAARLGAPVVAVALNQGGATDVTTAAGAAGVAIATAGDEASFRSAFERAWRAGTPMLVDAHVSR